jgi:hypothetical protein
MASKRMLSPVAVGEPVFCATSRRISIVVFQVHRSASIGTSNRAARGCQVRLLRTKKVSPEATTGRLQSPAP